MTDEHVIIFVKNPVPGTVKTRIARTVGNDQATTVYRHLLRHTQALASQLTVRPVVYYGDFINPDDGWNGYPKHLQTGDDLGQRMLHAFREQFEAGATRVVIIGSDCLDITPAHIGQAFEALNDHDVVIGPAMDGGYYLLGMRAPFAFVFENKPWSQPELLPLTLAELTKQKITYTLLEYLSDIDEWADYEAHLNKP
ncbi:TIGR04282 family arsenosugar biosynthesis glycosyltransferase [Arsenicibacter rosenii]|uniref:Glycosyltransferase n=1 Tax=Arsenicibacter rosenii TaxID=1750698 RepID=A0A1S2VHD4_9BACT|nr:TIGR04282 family arsenosugar biosynthesis glycosyltransferase [Arsenicibacter rosenii]OIN58167.1 glycosyltransferase [Arsenicibacter rosenii]